MKRGGSSGGGQSSLGYLFGSESNQKSTNVPLPPATYTTPPYGIDVDDEKSPETFPRQPDKAKAANKGLNSGKSITGRPSTKVKSPPGGDSSLGYLFGDKS